MAANSVTVPQVFLPTTFCSYKRTISLASLTCEGCDFRPISEPDQRIDDARQAMSEEKSGPVKTGLTGLAGTALPYYD